MAQKKRKTTRGSGGGLGIGKAFRRLLANWRQVFAVIALFFFLLVLRMFVWPGTDAPGRVDAIVVAGGSREYQLDRALELMNEEVAPVLVLPEGVDPEWERGVDLCRNWTTYEVACSVEHQRSARGEAQVIGDLIGRRGWNEVLLVTPVERVSRSRLLLERCTAAEISIIGFQRRLSSVIGETREYLADLFYGDEC